MKSPKKACPYDENNLIKLDRKTFPFGKWSFDPSRNGVIGGRFQRII
jgi:hypothetical protein